MNLEAIDAALESKRGTLLSRFALIEAHLDQEHAEVRVWMAYEPKFEVVAQVTSRGQTFQGRGAYIEEALDKLNDALLCAACQ